MKFIKLRLLPLLAGSTITSLWFSTPVQAIIITIDYSYDTNSFFSDTTAKASLEAAAQFYSDNFTDDFDAITPGGSNTWTAKITHPGDGTSFDITNPTIAANSVVIYAGGRDLTGSTLGVGGPGGFSASGTGTWLDTIRDRGQGDTSSASATEFATWGGSITFDNSGTAWHFDHTTTTGLPGNADFYSVALHELAHVLGIGTADSWDNQQSGAAFSKLFTGSVATTLFGSNPPLQTNLDPPGHLKEGTMSTVYGGGASQEAMMDPSITIGSRKLPTDLDMALFDDIGWDIVPEPSSTSLFIISALVLLTSRRRKM